jgi:8-oxo-dGTP pyrophosphatase MutT (NUDIX family)
VLAQLAAYVARYPADRARAEEVMRFIRRHDDCLLRTCRPGHVTASAWIVSADHRDVLLVEHRKLGRWLQPGGHADGEEDPWRVALREAHEETGLETFSTVPADDVAPLDVDVHRIPAHGGEPSHLHLDIRYLLVAATDERPHPSAESLAVRWVPRDRLRTVTTETSILRMDERARERLLRG